MASTSTKKTKGRQKIAMKKIEKVEDKLITFSKRRSGINKKASELVTLTGVKIGFVVYSPSGKPFSFGHPSMEAIANRFFDRQGEAGDITNPLVEAHRLMRIDDVNNHHNKLLEMLDKEKEREKDLKQKMRGVERNGWWDIPIEDLHMQQPWEMENACKNFQVELMKSLRKINVFASSNGPWASQM